MRYLLLCAALVFACGCGSRDTVEDTLETRAITLPNGREVRAEVKIRPVDLQRGMMFRNELPRGRGMLFIHSKPGLYPYFMYNVRIPLDIVWMDTNRHVIEIAENAPPCKTNASACPTYGGRYASQYVLELGAGEAARNGVKVGETLAF